MIESPGNVLSQLLRGERVRLTAFEPTDLPIFARWYQDTAFLRRWDAAPAMPKTEKQLADYIAEQQKSPTAFPFAIRLLEEDNLIGYCDLDGIEWAQGTGWLSIGIGDPAMRGGVLGLRPCGCC